MEQKNGKILLPKYQLVYTWGSHWILYYEYRKIWFNIMKKSGCGDMISIYCLEAILSIFIKERRSIYMEIKRQGK